jgi:hypothetical protein
MWKISLVMMVTALFAGLLIYDPYQASLIGAVPPSASPGTASVASAPALEAVPSSAATAPPPVNQEDIKAIVLQVLAQREPAGTPADKQVTAAEPPPPMQEQPRLQPAFETSVVRPVSNGSSTEFQERPRREFLGRIEIPAPQNAVHESGGQSALSRPSNGLQDRELLGRIDIPAPQNAVHASVAQPALSRPSNGFQDRPNLAPGPQAPIGQPVFPKREEPPARTNEASMSGTCTIGEVIGLDPNGDNFLSVRSGPGGQPYHEIDRLFSAEEVHVCGEKAPWLAIAYSPARRAGDRCDLAATEMRRASAGACQYGWVHSRYIKLRTDKTRPDKAKSTDTAWWR